MVRSWGCWYGSRSNPALDHADREAVTGQFPANSINDVSIAAADYPQADDGDRSGASEFQDHDRGRFGIDPEGPSEPTMILPTVFARQK